MLTAEPGLAGLVLAAGASTRLGEPKQLFRWQDEALLERAVRLALAGCGAGVTVVTGAHAARVEPLLSALPVAVARNVDWEQGMATSLRCGTQAVAATPARAVLVLLCDQPLISSADIELMIATWRSRPDQPVAARYNESNGVPAIFPRTLFAALTNRTGDRGAQQLLAALPADRLLNIAAAALDIDSPEDLIELQRHSRDNQ